MKTNSDNAIEVDALMLAKIERMARAAGKDLGEYIAEVIAKKANRLPG